MYVSIPYKNILMSVQCIKSLSFFVKRSFVLDVTSAIECYAMHNKLHVELDNTHVYIMIQVAFYFLFILNNKSIVFGENNNYWALHY